MKDNNELMFRAVRVSLFGNIILFALKSAAIMMVHSLAIATDLGITLVGLIVSIILYYSVKISNKPADLLHNYGYGKIEYICEAMEGAVLIGIAIVMSWQAVLHLLHPSEISFPWRGFTFSAVGSVINFIGAAWILSIGKRCHSPAVRAEGLHYQLEGFISLTVAASFLLSALLSLTALKPWVVFLDPAATLAVSLLIALPSFNLAKHAVMKLLDSSIEEKGKMEVIKQLAKYIDRCCEFRDIRSRGSGRTNFVELKLVLPPAMSFTEAHQLAAQMERDLVDNIPECKATVIIIPCDQNCVTHAPVSA